MFGFMRKPGARGPSALAVVEQRGRYHGRAATYIGIFEPAWARAVGVEVRAFGDLDAHPDLVLKSGHVER